MKAHRATPKPLTGWFLTTAAARIMADDGEVIRRAFALGDIRKAVRRIRVSGGLR